MADKQINRTVLSQQDSTALEEVGRIRIESDGKMYRYVKNSRTATYTKGTVMVIRSSDGYSVTGSRPVSALFVGGKNSFAGVAAGTIGALKYGWVQYGGFCSNMKKRPLATSIPIYGMLGVHSTCTQGAGFLSSSTLLGRHHRIGVNLKTVSSHCVCTAVLLRGN